MGHCNSILSIHSGMGTTRHDRVKPALQPGFFRLDERSEEDFILFVQKLSAYVKFYNEFDIADGNWSGFFQKESTSILILIAHWNIELLQNSFDNKKNEIFINNDLPSQKAILLDYFKDIQAQFDSLAEKSNALDDEITEKEKLVASAYVISEKFASILGQVAASSDITSLLKNYVFAKTVQQLFGLLLSWKNSSQNSIANQLNTYAKHAPHYTLFLSFLKLLNVAKDKFNEFTKKHLDFYYKNVLHTQNQTAQPDYVHLVAEPFGTKPFLVPKGTIFPAGKNTAGKNKFYASTTDHTVNSAKFHSFLSTHFSDNILNKADLLKVNGKNKGFDVFTTGAETFKESLMLAGPILYMQSGERIIYLRFNDSDYNAADFDFYITGEKKVIQITSIENEAERNGTKKIKLTIPATEKKIMPFDKKLHPEFELETTFPVLKIVPKAVGIISSISKIELDIKVNNFKSFVLESDFGAIDIKKPFYPFGEFPTNGNALFLSSNEFFMKKNAKAAFTMLTMTVKVSARTDRNGRKTKERNVAVEWLKGKTKVSQLENGSWIESGSVKALSNNYPITDYRFDEIASNDIISNGKIKIELDTPTYSGDSFMESYIAQSQLPSPNLPYKPRINEFVFNYSASETVEVFTRERRQLSAANLQVYKSMPFGYSTYNRATVRFAQNDTPAGKIYLGFENALPHDGLTFLMQLEEGTANPQLEPAQIAWHFLNGNSWTAIEKTDMGDETLSLTQSGLVSITVPEFTTTNSTQMPPGLFWLRISVTNIQAVCRFLGVHTQALKAVLTDFENTGIGFTEQTPKETISKVYRPINSLKKISQPYPSFYGRTAEPDETLYTRTSERLRHKNRAITTWDYERIILQEFPDVYRVKALNHYRYDTLISNVAAGYVTLIPIARSSVTDNINWKPLLSLNKMLKIKEHLYKVASPHARINVKPPKAEKVQVNFKVKFHETPGMDNRLYIAKLKETINAYLSPWAYEGNDDIGFAGEMEFSSIIQLVDNQEYVDYITDFKITQYVLNENSEVVGSPIQNLNKITPQTDFTLFIPNESHLIAEI